MVWGLWGPCGYVACRAVCCMIIQLELFIMFVINGNSSCNNDLYISSLTFRSLKFPHCGKIHLSGFCIALQLSMILYMFLDGFEL